MGLYSRLKYGNPDELIARHFTIGRQTKRRVGIQFGANGRYDRPPEWAAVCRTCGVDRPAPNRDPSWTRRGMRFHAEAHERRGERAPLRAVTR